MGTALGRRPDAFGGHGHPSWFWTTKVGHKAYNRLLRRQGLFKRLEMAWGAVGRRPTAPNRRARGGAWAADRKRMGGRHGLHGGAQWPQGQKEAGGRNGEPVVHEGPLCSGRRHPRVLGRRTRRGRAAPAAPLRPLALPLLHSPNPNTKYLRTDRLGRGLHTVYHGRHGPPPVARPPPHRAVRCKRRGRTGHAGPGVRSHRAAKVRAHAAVPPHPPNSRTPAHPTSAKSTRTRSTPAPVTPGQTLAEAPHHRGRRRRARI